MKVIKKDQEFIEIEFEEEQDEEALQSKFAYKTYGSVLTRQNIKKFV